ncbi:hypothetical protein ACFYXP_38075 [Streptomyces sp. NPDC002466]|uniref:hypothetical protein n=1 Tax=Streptomyces sp. NPDC002466 TaxID=3364646 RepID=UPI00368BDDA9
MTTPTQQEDPMPTASITPGHFPTSPLALGDALPALPADIDLRCYVLGQTRATLDT